MYEVVPFLPEHIFSLDLCNLDKYTENFSLDFYFYYLLNHNTESYSIKNISSLETNELYSEQIIGYLIGANRKEIILINNKEKNILKTHVSALTIAPSERNKGLGCILMNLLEENGNFINSYFCDLFVKIDNFKAIKFYEKSGYFVYRKIFDYYSLPIVDAFDMRKSLDADKCNNNECNHKNCGYFNNLIGKNINQSEL